MNLNDIFNFLNFYINKFTGSWYTIEELEDLLDFGQMALYSDLKPKYATSQLIKDALSPFRETYNFTTQISGYVIVPDSTYLDLLDIQIYFQVSNRTVYYPVDLVNEDTRAQRLNSQIDPVTITSPIGEQTAPRTFRLYPIGVYNGNVTYLRRPIKPVFGYSVISGRIIVYDPNTSTQLEWRETEIPSIIIKALSSIGINIGSQEVMQWSEIKSQQNYLNTNRQ
ncbi:MAG TPA: hypothetical protein PJ987_11210 [Bacteroidia bacterium]|nr:hypothetical protein [Bacteroidia bacterium]